MVYRARSNVYHQMHLDDRQKRLEEMNHALELAPNDFRVLSDHAGALNALARFEEALAESRRVVEIEPNSDWAWGTLLGSFWNLERLDELREKMDELRRCAESWANARAAAEAFNILSTAHRRLGKHEEAVNAAERMIELDPQNLDGYAQRITALKAEHGNAAIEYDCDRLATLELSEPEPLERRAGLLMNSCGRPEAALADYAAAIELAPQWADPYCDRANFHYDRGQYAAALSDYDAAIERAPKWKDPQRSRALTLAKLKRYDEALVSISRAIELSPNSANAIYNRALIYFDLERYGDVLTDMERCFELVGGRGRNNGRWLQAQALQRLARDKEAIEMIGLGIADDPSWPEAYRRKAQLLFEKGRIDEMRATAARAVEVAPGEWASQIWTALSRLFPEARCAEARTDLDRARELAPDDPETLRNVAIVHAIALYALCPTEYDGDLALRLAREAVEKNPEDANRQSTLGLALYRHERFGEAREALDRAVDLATPKPDAVTLFALAMVEERGNHPTEARSRYEEAVERTSALALERSPLNRLLQDEAAEVLGLQ